jgi:peptidyl-prolyl cis-trans isomerase SurA
MKSPKRIVLVAIGLIFAASGLRGQNPPPTPSPSTPPAQQPQQPSSQQAAPQPQPPPSAPQEQPGTPAPLNIENVTAPKPDATPAPPASAPAHPKSFVLEEVVARVNDEVITTSDLQQSRDTLMGDVRQSCTGCTPEQIQAQYDAKQPDILRDLIDQSLLVQRAKDMDINVESDVVKRLDEIRQSNNIASMEELESKIEAAGLDYEDYKSNIRTELLTQEVIRREVGSRIIISHEEVGKYYKDHPDEFTRPEQVVLREIFINTDKKDPADIPALRKKADDMLNRVHNGDDFGELAKHFSDGSTAAQGGELGVFKHDGTLATDIEDKVFKLNRNEVTDVIEAKTGFLIIQVEQHYAAGLQPLDKVEEEINSKLYMSKMEPALRDYLKQLRQDSFVEVKPGYVDTAAVPSTGIVEVSPVPDATKKKNGTKRFWLFGKRRSTTSSSS